MRSILLMVSVLTLAAEVAAASPIKAPVETQPPCKWSKKFDGLRKWNGVWVCKSDQVVRLVNQNTRSCGMIVYKPDIRIVRFDLSFFPKKRGGDPFGMYAIKSTVDNSLQGNNAPQIAYDAQNLIKDANGPRHVTGDYVCRTYMEIRP